MSDQSGRPGFPPVVSKATWQTERDALFVREKAHTRGGDAIAAARRRLPMVEVDATVEVIGPGGPTTILDAFEGPVSTVSGICPGVVSRPARSWPAELPRGGQ